LGIPLNNQAKLFALWQGLELAITSKIQQLMVFGDSMIVIQQACKLKKDLVQIHSSILHRINLQITKFENVEFFHANKYLNLVADSLENQGIST